MKKIIIIICLLFLSIPLILYGQFEDFFMMDDMLLDDTGPEINLKTLELYWSTDTYVPFEYQGRKLPTRGSLVTVGADLKITGGTPASLKYSWFLDDVFQEAKSGYGRDSFQFRIRRSKDASHEVLLKVFNENRSFFVEKSIIIPITGPEIIILAESFDLISDEESSFTALPYFFNVKSLKDLEFTWSFADKTVTESSFAANVFGLKIINKKVGGSLEETLKVIATNKKQTDQRVQKTIKINIY